jgi:hypothetical protein
MSFGERLKSELLRLGGPPAFGESPIEVPPSDPEGFTVWAAVAPGHITVGYDGWHEEFTAEGTALTCFLKGVFGQSRLAVVKRGEFAQSWTAEELVGDGWRPVSVTGLLFFPFWRSRRTVHLHNNRTPGQTLQ